MAPSQQQTRDKEYRDLYTKVALLEKEIEEVKQEAEEVTEDLQNIKSYFFKFLMFVGGVVGVYFIEWALKFWENANVVIAP